MKLRVRTLKNVEYVVDIPASASVVALKEEIEKVVPSMESAKLLVIHQGRILSNSATLADYSNIREFDKLVVLMPKAKATAGVTSAEPGDATAADKDSAETSCSAAAIASSPTSSPKAPADATATETISSVPAQAGSAAGTPPATGATSLDGATSNSFSAAAPGEAASAVAGESAASPRLSDEQEAIVQALCGMGFENGAVRQALIAAFYNPERAVEYLTSGMPPSATEPGGDQTAPESAAPVEPGEPESMEADAGRRSYGIRSLDGLRAHPLFEQFRAAIQANPQLLPGMLQMFSNQNPELAELIVNNQAEFLQMMMETPDTHHSEGGPGITTAASLEDSAIHSQIQQVSPGEMQAIQNLKALGFSESESFQALIACDWNEERAANFLFDIEDDDGDPADEGDGSAPQI